MAQQVKADGAQVIAAEASRLRQSELARQPPVKRRACLLVKAPADLLVHIRVVILFFVRLFLIVQRLARFSDQILNVFAEAEFKSFVVVYEDRFAVGVLDGVADFDRLAEAARTAESAVNIIQAI